MHPRSRAIGAGVAGTLVWAALEPIDKRVFRHDYSDVAVLDLAPEEGEGAKAESAQGGVEMRGAHGAAYALPAGSPF